MKKKPKSFNELLYQQRWEKASEKSFRKLERNVNKNAREKIELVRNDPTVAKMSDVLREFVAPYIRTLKNKKQIQTLFETAVSAWNLAVMPEEERNAVLDELLPKEERSSVILTGIDFLDELIQRKQKYFKDNRRMIMDFQVEYLGQGEYHLSVASTEPKPALE